MARVWVYDREKRKRYRDAVAKAKAAGRTPPDRWEVCYYDRRGRLRSETVRTKTVAGDRRTELEAALAGGTYVDPVAAKVTFSEVAEAWIEAQHHLKPTTWWKYRGLLDNHVIPEWGDLRLEGIDRDAVARWVGKLLRAKDKGGSGLGASQTRHAYRVLFMVLGWCVPSRLVSNPAAGIALPVRPDAEHVYLGFEQVEALARAGATLRTKYERPTAAATVNRVLILLLAYTGIRWGEAAALRVHRIDLGNRRMRIATTFYELNGVQGEGLPKNGKRRTVAIPASLLPDLDALMAGKSADDLLFTTARGLSLRANNWRVREFNAAVAAAGLGKLGLTPHKLRHTAASLAIAAGADVKVLQLMLGHADAAMTLNVYGHLFPDRLDEVANSLDARRVQALSAAA